jgi:hypothetical protein
MARNEVTPVMTRLGVVEQISVDLVSGPESQIVICNANFLRASKGLWFDSGRIVVIHI